MSVPPPDEVLAEIAWQFPHLRGRLSLDSRLTDLHLDSLDFVELYCLLDQTYAVRLNEADLESAATLRDVVSRLSSRVSAGTIREGVGEP